MALQWVELDDYRGGFHNQTSGVARLPRGSWYGNNVVVARDGSLTVRNGLVQMSISGVPNGVMHGFRTQPALTNNIWFIVGSTVYRASLGTSSTASSIGTLAVEPTGVVASVRDGFNHIITVDGDKSYEVSSINAVLNPLTGSPGGQAIARFGSRLMVADGGQIKYSDVNNWNSWPVANVFDVGDPLCEITALLQVRDALFIFTNLNGVYVVYGSNPTNWVLRRVTTAIGALFHNHAVEWEGAPVGFRLSGQAAAPSVLNGTKFDPLRHLGNVLAPNWLTQWEVGGAYATYDRTVMYFDGSERTGLVFRSPGVWTKHTFGVAAAMSGHVELNDQGAAVLATAGSASTAPVFYMWQADHSENAGAGTGVLEVASDPGVTTGVVGEVWLPEITDKDCRDFQVRELVIEAITYDTGTSDNPLLTAVCEPVTGVQNDTTSATGASRLPSMASTVGASATWGGPAVPSTASSTSGTRRTIRLTFGNQPVASTWRLGMTLRGVRILHVKAGIEVAPSRL